MIVTYKTCKHCFKYLNNGLYCSKCKKVLSRDEIIISNIGCSGIMVHEEEGPKLELMPEVNNNE